MHVCMNPPRRVAVAVSARFFAKFEPQRDPHWAFLHTAREKEKVKRLNWHTRSPSAPSEFLHSLDRSKKRLLFTLRLSKHCGLPSGKRGEGYCIHLLKNKSLMKAE